MPGQQMIVPKGPEWGEALAGPKSPIVAVLLTLFCCFPFGHVYLGQTKKALFFFLFLIVSGVTAVGPTVVWILMLIDAYQLGEKMTREGSARAMENGLDLLDHVFGPAGLIKP